MKDDKFYELLTSAHEMDQIAKGQLSASRVTEFPFPKVKAIREKVGLSQNRFAMLIGVSKRTLENWEQGRRRRLRQHTEDSHLFKPSNQSTKSISLGRNLLESIPATPCNCRKRALKIKDY